MNDRPRRLGSDMLSNRAPSLSRRDLMMGMACCGLGTTLSTIARADDSAQHAEGNVVSAEEAQRRLVEGNKRFVEEHSLHDHEAARWRSQLVAEQHPFAVIVGCADSRVPIELIFDQGFGDLFVIRNAGNLVATDVVASVEYAVTHLNTNLVVVMGHEGCGAVTAALQAREIREREPMELQTALRMIEVGLTDVKLNGSGGDRIAQAVEWNVRYGVKRLNYLAAERGAPAMGSARCVGAVYELKTGKVRFLS